MPWSFLLELHGWWHVFTGAGAYICESFFLFLSILGGLLEGEGCKI